MHWLLTTVVYIPFFTGLDSAQFRGRLTKKEGGLKSYVRKQSLIGGSFKNPNFLLPSTYRGCLNCLYVQPKQMLWTGLFFIPYVHLDMVLGIALQRVSIYIALRRISVT